MHRFAALAVVALVGGCAAADANDAVSESGDALTTKTAHAKEVLYGKAAAPACDAGDDDARVRCLVSARYAADPAARDLALDLYATTGGIAGVLPAQTSDEGYRGTIQFVPELPVNGYRKHLGFVRDAMRDFDGFFARLDAAKTTPIHYRFRGVDLRYFRSVGRTTPSAYTEGTWEVAYNVSGSLVQSASTVRETLFHELLHVNDWDLGGEEPWSRALAPIVNGIVARCGTRTACLAPYTPTKTLVKGGTYYAFQPNNGDMVMEYAAELATRYYGEQDAVMHGQPLGDAPFKCGTPENAKAWSLLVNAFFGGADLVPACP